MNPLFNVIDFLVHVSFTLYIYAVIIRMLLGATRADFHNPFAQFILTVTTPALQPLRKWLPGIGQLDTAALVVVILLKFVALLIHDLLTGKEIMFGLLIIYTIFGLVDLVINLFILAIIVLALLSWIAPHVHVQNSPLTFALRAITDPLLQPARRYIPPIGIFDLSPLVVVVALYCIKIFLGSIYFNSL